MKRRSKFLIFLPTVLLLLLAATMAWLLRSESGARFIWQQAGKQIDGQLTAEQLRGNLSSVLVLHGLSYRDDSVHVQSPDLQVSLNIDLFPPALRLSRLNSSSIQVQLLEATGTADNKENSPAATLAGLQLPYPVRFDAVTLGKLEIIDAEDAQRFAASDIALQAVWHQKLEILQARLRRLDTGWTTVQVTDLNLGAVVHLQPPFNTNGKVAADTVLTVGADENLPLQLQGEFSGSLERLATKLQVQLPATLSTLYVEGELLELLATPAWDLQLNSAALNWPLTAAQASDTDSSESPVALRDIHLSSQGSLEAYDVQLAARLSGEHIPVVAAELMGSGDLNGMDIDHFRFDGDELKLSGSGQLGWLQAFSVKANSHIDYLHPGRWLSDWPNDHPFSGDLELSLTDEQIEFNNLQLDIVGLPTRAQGHVAYQFSDENIAGELSWQSLAWPIGADNPDFSSDSGQLKLQGTLADWHATGSLQLLADGLPEGQLQLEATGDTDAIHLVINQGNILGGRFAGTADYQWTEPTRWSAHLTANRIGISPLLPEYPGVLSGTVLAQGGTDNDELQVELRDVQGRIRGLDISAKGKFFLQGSHFTAQGLELKSRSARLELDGGLGPGQKLDFLVRTDELAELFPDISGRIVASGQISTDAKSPFLDIQLEADRLQWGENTIASVRSHNGPDGSQVIEIPEAELFGRALRDLRLTLHDNQLQSIRLDGLMDRTELEATLLGQLQAGQQGEISGWQGQLSSLRLRQPEEGFLHLQSPALLDLSGQHLKLGAVCMRGTRDGQICLQGHWDKSGPGAGVQQGNAALQASVQNVSLDIVRLFVNMDWAFTHRLNGSFDWQKTANQAASAQAQFSLTPGELLFDEERTHFSTGPGIFEFQVSEGNLHSGKLELPIPGSGGIDMDFQVSQLLNGAEADLQAVLKLHLKDLTPLQLVVPHLDVIKGEFDANVRISGTLEQPRFTGHATLVRGHIEEQSAGLVISDIQLAGAVYQYDHTELYGSFRAGEGKGQIKADLRFGDFLHPEFTMQLKGDNLLLVDVPDLNVLANPDLDISWTPGNLQLNGSLRVSKAQLSPRYLPASSATESPDLVIVSAQPETAQTVEVTTGPLKITGQVEVELGPDVNLTLDKATANIHGKSNFIWNNNLMPMGDGAFLVSGEIYAYGQLLSISEGRVSFPRVPADNPYLNIKAEREIFGNTQIKRAGVLVSGTLKRPSLDPYTDPMTTRERALAMLITGSDFDYEQGVGAVEVGMYIAPKLFISYGIGLFEDSNVISARYDLGKGFGVKATSGQRETGVDISYTVDQ